MKKIVEHSEPIPLEDLADKLSQVRWHGSYISALCIYHDDSRPSMLVYADGWFQCLTCGVNGSHQRLSRKLSGKAIRRSKESKSVIPPWRSWENKYGSWKKAAEAAYENAKGFPGLVSYVSNRGMRQYLTRARIGWLDGWYSFPVFNSDGKIVDWVVRADPRKNSEVKYATRPRLQPGESHLYCPDWQRVEQASEIYLPFGILDTWALYAAGLPTLTGITGQILQPDLLNDIRKTIYIIPDRGEDRGARRLREALGWRGKILYLDYQDDCKDCNDVLCKHGVKSLVELIGDKQWIGSTQAKSSLEELQMGAKT